MRMIILGPPGAGKGTQASGIASALGIPAISTGAMFRENISAGTELGLRVKDLLASGRYVPDDITNEMLFERLQRDDTEPGFLLDGYPRTEAQVEALDGFLAERGEKIDCVLQLTVDTDAVVARLLKRAEEEGRPDDTESVIRERQTIYAEETAPLTRVYGERGLLVRVDGMGDIDEVGARIREAVGAVAA